MDQLLMVGIAFILTFFIGQWLEKLRIPWIFAALLLGTAMKSLSLDVSGGLYETLSELGLYFMLFMIGLEIDTREMAKLGRIVVGASLAIIGFEALVMGLFIHFLFSLPLHVSFLVSLSFATVGEAILLPILDELGILRKKLGQIILGIATADDLFELMTFILLVFVITGKFQLHSLLVFIALLIFTIVSLRFHASRKFFSMPVETLFLLVISILFLFLGIGKMSGEEEIAAIFAGIVASHSMPKGKFSAIEKEIKSLAYGFFGPLFFLSIGYEADPSIMLSGIGYVLAVVLVSNLSKIVSSMLMLGREIGMRKSIFAGIALSTRFSTSLVIAKLLYDSGTISNSLFSIIVASSMVFKFVIPPLLSYLARKWRVG